MTRYDLALIGFGGVNRALAELIVERGEEFTAELGFSLRVVAITDLRAGTLVTPDGIDLPRILATAPEELDFSQMPGGSSEALNRDVIRHGPGDIIVEATFTNPGDGEPGLSHIRWALEAGKHVCTTNKGPVALHGGGLRRLAAENGVRLEFEGSVLSGTPVLRTAEKLLAGLRINGVEGIMNGTSNYILGRLEEGADFAEAVREAQALGYAEADPTSDIEGLDVQLKMLILANEVLGGSLSREDVAREGISALSAADIQDAAVKGFRWKLVGQAIRNEDGSIAAKVGPIAVPADHPLAGVTGPTNAVSFHTDLLGTITVTGPGAGRTETAYALLSDIIAIHREHRATLSQEASHG